MKNQPMFLLESKSKPGDLAFRWAKRRVLLWNVIHCVPVYAGAAALAVFTLAGVFNFVFPLTGLLFGFESWGSFADLLPIGGLIGAIGFGTLISIAITGPRVDTAQAKLDELKRLEVRAV